MMKTNQDVQTRIVHGAPACIGHEQHNRAAERFAYEEITLKELEKGYAEGTFKTEEVVKAYLDRIGIYESNYNAFTMMNAGALQEATEVDRRRAAGEKLGPLQVCRLSSRKPSTSPASRPPSAGPRSAKSSAESS